MAGSCQVYDLQGAVWSLAVDIGAELDPGQCAFGDIAAM
jgi:hypothetical protein